MGKPIAQGKSNVTMTIRVNEEQHQAVKEQAEKKKMSQSWYLMELVEKDIKEEKESLNG